ncbi:MAG: hypothetical protein KF902_07500 [Phycisphaeraceae bacterium]|nr:hypothetical protein [Phycisphaeraceae bacterium]
MTVVSNRNVTWRTTGGIDDGFIELFDPDTSYSFFRAPTSYRGDLRHAYSGSISFWQRTSHNALQQGRWIVIESGTSRITALATLPSVNTWVYTEIPIAEGWWHWGVGPSAPLASRDQIVQVLAEVTDFLFGAEYVGGQYERVGIDSVKLLCGFEPALTGSTAACQAAEHILTFGSVPLPNATYQWYRNGSPLGDGPTAWGSDIAGSQTYSLNISNIRHEDAGAYLCVIDGLLCGLVTSDAAYLDVYCACGTSQYFAGTNDNFALPKELTSPSNSLRDWLLSNRPGRPFHEFDEVPALTSGVASDSRLAHTFVSLPSTILGATLTTRVKAGGTGSNPEIAEGTDTIRLGFAIGAGSGAVENRVWERRFGDLPGAPVGLFSPGRLWTSGDMELFVLDLASLPTTARLGESDPSPLNLLPLLNDRGFLDITVVDETGVDFMTLDVKHTNGRVVPWVGGPIGPLQGFESGRVEISVETGGLGGPFTYQWQINGSDIDSVTNPTAATRVLVLDPLLRSDNGEYRCVVSGANTCGHAVSGPLRLRVLCLVDYNTYGDEGDIIDFLDFMDDFGSCTNLSAPCGQFGNPDLNGDTIIDIVDLLDFLDAFGQGC